MAFARYAFDMSKFSNQGHDVTLGIRERYLWELMSPEPKTIRSTSRSPGQFRAELHDRFMAPIYPFAFAALTFAFLGAPRTTRQSRNFSIGGSILAVFGLRMAGFACSVMAVKSPLAPLVPISDAARGDRRRASGSSSPASSSNRRRVLLEAINKIERAPAAAVRTAGHRMSMVTNTLGRYFAGRFVISALGVFVSIFAAAGAGRLHRDGPQDLRARVGVRDHGRRDVAVSRAATARKDDAVLHPDRGDDLLSRAVAAARTGGRARRRRFGLAVHRAGAGQRDRCSACIATTAYNPMSANLRELSKRMEAELLRLGARRRRAGCRRLLDQSDQCSDGQAIINAARSEQQGVRLTGLTVFTFDND